MTMVVYDDGDDEIYDDYGDGNDDTTTITIITVAILRR